MISPKDIIAAPATAWGEGAIAIVRLSGDGSTALVDTFFEGRRSLRDEPARRMALGRIKGVDTVLAVRFDRGASYTGDESVEVHCHGGSAAASACMELFTSAGARVAEPGEFTLRAYLNGRIDLAQAEAVAGVISAASDEALAASRRSLQGELSRELEGISTRLTTIRASLEAAMDHPEELEGDDISPDLRSLIDDLSSLKARCTCGHALRGGAVVAIVGPPNAGKSSLMNAMLGRERSIVTPEAGTTRDTIDARFVYKGLPITLIDTAGVRAEDEARDDAEKMGIARAIEAASSADIVIAVEDITCTAPQTSILKGTDAKGPGGSAPLHSLSPAAGTDRTDLWDLLKIPSFAIAPKRYAPIDRPIFIVKNKSDLVPGAETSGGAGAFYVSALFGHGVEELLDAVWSAAVGGVPISEGYAVTSRALASMTSALRDASEALGLVALDEGAAGSLLGDAARSIASVLGVDADEKLLDAIFSDFCVGK